MTSSDNSDGAQKNTFDIKTNASYDATFLCMAESSDHNLRIQITDWVFSTNNALYMYKKAKQVAK